MAKTNGVINSNRTLGKINKEIYGHFQSIWEDVFMKEFLWVKIRRFQIPTE